MPVTLNAPPQPDFTQPIELLSDCHRRIERFLETLQLVAERAVQGPLDDEHVNALKVTLAYFAQAAVRHTADEEQSLFPLLRRSSDPRAAGALEQIDRLEQDHRRGDLLHQQIHRLGECLVEKGELPACEAKTLLDAVRALRAIYTPHIAAEDTVLFPLAKSVLSQAVLMRVGGEMAERRRIAPGREGSRCAERRTQTLSKPSRQP